MIHQTFINAMEVLVLISMLCFAISKVKRMFIANVATVSRVTDDGEQISMNVEFTSFDSVKKRNQKLQELLGHGDYRRDFCHKRFMKTIEEAQNEKAKTIKAV